MDEPRITVTQSRYQNTVRRIPFRSISLAIVVSVLFYVGMVTLADWDAFGDAVSALPSLLWVHLVVLSFLSYFLRFTRWHHFIVSMGHKVPILINLDIYLSAFALTLTPGKAGETIRSVYLYSYGIGYPRSIGAFVSERILDLVAVGAMASLAASMFPEYKLWVFAVIIFIVISVLLFRYRVFGFIGRRFAKSSVVGHAENLVGTIRFLLSGTRVVVAAPLSLMAWFAQGVSLYLIVQALGYELAIGTVVSIYCLSILAGAASFIPGGLGATEAAIVLLLIGADVAQSDAVAAAIISRGLTLWLAVGVGCLALTKLALAHKKIHPSA